jgi:hypothetical protein
MSNAQRADARRPITLADVCKDRCNFTDSAFAEWVTDFMNKHVPSFPLGLLDTDSPEAFERWQIQPEDRFEVVELKLIVHTCHDCGEEYTFCAGSTEEPKVCCPMEALAAQGDDDPELFEVEDCTWLVLRDTHYGDDTFVDNAGDHSIDLPDGSSIWGWYEASSDDAQHKANEKNYEAMNEGMHGFPWANMWCFRPEDFITDQELKDAGFTVATYCGGKGDWREDNEYRLCGLDGGGYSFKGQHFAPLAAAVAARGGWTVPTDSGDAYFLPETHNNKEE